MHGCFKQLCQTLSKKQLHAAPGRIHLRCSLAGLLETPSYALQRLPITPIALPNTCPYRILQCTVMFAHSLQSFLMCFWDMQYMLQHDLRISFQALLCGATEAPAILHGAVQSSTSADCLNSDDLVGQLLLKDRCFPRNQGRFSRLEHSATDLTPEQQTQQLLAGLHIVSLGCHLQLELHSILNGMLTPGTWTPA